MPRKLTTSMKAGMEVTLLDIVGNIIQGAKIKRGYLFQEIVSEFAKEKYDEVLKEEKIKTISNIPEVLNPNGYHKVDVIGLNHKEKICELIDVKSAGMNHNETPGAVQAMMDGAKNGAKERWSEYKINYFLVKPGGDSGKGFSDLNIETKDISSFIGKNINIIIKKRYKKIVLEKTKEACDKFNLKREEVNLLFEMVNTFIDIKIA